MRTTPIIVMIVPVTTAGKKGSTCFTKAVRQRPNTPPKMTAP